MPGILSEQFMSPLLWIDFLDTCRTTFLNDWIVDIPAGNFVGVILNDSVRSTFTFDTDTESVVEDAGADVDVDALPRPLSPGPLSCVVNSLFISSRDTANACIFLRFFLVLDIGASSSSSSFAETSSSSSSK